MKGVVLHNSLASGDSGGHVPESPAHVRMVMNAAAHIANCEQCRWQHLKMITFAAPLRVDYFSGSYTKTAIERTRLAFYESIPRAGNHSPNLTQASPWAIVLRPFRALRRARSAPMKLIQFATLWVASRLEDLARSFIYG